MPIKISGHAKNPDYIDFDGGFGWLAQPGEGMQRASYALETGEGLWLVDPIDTAGLDDRLAANDGVVGVVLLLDRHERDVARIANRHGVPVTRPPGIDRVVGAPTQDVTDGLPGTAYRFLSVLDAPFWQEIGLWDGNSLVVPESLGTNGYFRVGSERVGLHPFARLLPPRHLTTYSPKQLLVGHGYPLLDDVSPAIETGVANARWGLPKALFELHKAFL